MLHSKLDSALLFYPNSITEFKEEELKLNEICIKTIHKQNNLDVWFSMKTYHTHKS